MSEGQKQDLNPGRLLPIRDFFLCPTLLILLPPSLQMLGIPFKVNTILNSVFNVSHNALPCYWWGLCFNFGITSSV